MYILRLIGNPLIINVFNNKLLMFDKKKVLPLFQGKNIFVKFLYNKK